MIRISRSLSFFKQHFDLNLSTNILIIFLLLLNTLHESQEQFINNVVDRPFTEDLIWCTTSAAEQSKCQEWADAIKKVREIPKFGPYNLKCEQASDREQCMNHIDNGRAHLVTLDPGELFIAGRHHSLVPIAAEKYGNAKENGFYSVAVVKKSSSTTIQYPYQLRNKKACFPGVGNMAGWSLPLTELIRNGTIEVKDCNNIVKTAAGFFGESCAPQALNDKNNPSGDNPQSICSLCQSKCSGSDAYAHFDGAFKCLMDRGDVAFLRHPTPELMSRRMRNYPIRDSFELLCKEGGRMPLESYRSCNWGYSPAKVIVVLSSKREKERENIQKFLNASSWHFNPRSRDDSSNPTNWRIPATTFRLTDYDTTTRWGERADLLFSDDLVGFEMLKDSQQTFRSYLGGYNYELLTKNMKRCPVPNAKFCVTSEPEKTKCIDMLRTFRGALLKPDLSCVLKPSASSCMAAIQSGEADLAMLDAGDVYRAGNRYGLIPILAEKYDLRDPSYYVVAVSRKSDKDTDLNYLRGVTSCHTGVGMAAGWVVPLSFLISNNRMRAHDCDSVHAASQFFQKSCAPGALLPSYASSDWSLSNLCDLCRGQSSHYCARDASEPFYGHSGALRCVIEAGGQVAFVKHTTIVENTAGRNPEFWSRNLIPEDFELLCRDGTRAAHNMSARCNIGKVAGNALVTSKYKPPYHIDSYVNLFLTAQQSYGSKYSQGYTFKMFVSGENYHDLIFSDATSQLVALPHHKRDHRIYLGPEFINAMKLTDCTSHSLRTVPSFLTLTILFTLVPFLTNFHKFILT
ncbi:transferrin 2 [Brevipalpus obovatus]|uniref:transferrin 2 n=1 Tax=Brevipalpus obovatus TaxID=246614 RepID=UPI003D9FA1F3